MRKDAVLLEGITDQELDNVNGAGFCENMKGRAEGSEWHPAGLLETFWYYRKCKQYQKINIKNDENISLMLFSECQPGFL